MEKRWVVTKKIDIEKVNQLANDLGVDPIIADLLLQRNISTFEEAKHFFRPSLECLHDPFFMRDMNKAVCYIDHVIHQKGKILVYGDYDVDGTTAVALVYSYLSSFYDKVDYYIPSRDIEGYGISFKGIDFAKDNDFKLIIALDCGIKAFEQIAYAKANNIDIIVADHHLPGEKLPEAYAVLDPKRADCPYPDKDLSGCGIGFKLIQAHVIKNHKPREILYPYLDLVVTSIASDIVSITGENRILAYYGLKRLNTNPRPGIEAILKYSNVLAQNKQKEVVNSDGRNLLNDYFHKELTINDLVFLVGPRINAAGRIGDGKNSVRLLLSKTIEEAEQIALQVNNNNIERKNLDYLATEEAVEMVNNGDLARKKILTLYNPSWHKGVIGIVASRIVERFYKPTIIFTYSANNGLITGSARSVKGVDIHSAIESCSHLLEHFGGHKYAAGLSLKEENLQAFIHLLEEKMATFVTDEMLVREVEIDREISLNDITPKFIRILKQFAPFGPGNMSPVFQTNNIVDTGFSRNVGNNHLKFSAMQLDVRSEEYAAIAFQCGEYLEYVQAGKPFDICYHLEENTWNGKTTIQLNIKDIRLKNGNQL